jgi:hypothetical protein
MREHFPIDESIAVEALAPKGGDGPPAGVARPQAEQSLATASVIMA